MDRELERLAGAGLAASGRLNRRLQREMGITLSQYRVLAYLAVRQTASLGEMSRALGCTRGNVTGLVERLRLRNLVRREYSSRDRRYVLVGLTPRGRDRYGQARAAIRAFLEEYEASAPRMLPKDPDLLVVFESVDHADGWVAVEPPDPERVLHLEPPTDLPESDAAD